MFLLKYGFQMFNVLLSSVFSRVTIAQKGSHCSSRSRQRMTNRRMAEIRAGDASREGGEEKKNMVRTYIMDAGGPSC